MPRKSDVEVGPWPPMGPLYGDVGPVRLGPEGEDVILACTPEEDMARQEYALSSEIKYQISRFGVGHPLSFGEQDFDMMDRTRAMELLEAASQAWLSVPKAVRDRYASWANVEAAAQSGELAAFLKASGIDGSSLPSVADAAGGSGGTTPTPPKEAPTPS